MARVFVADDNPLVHRIAVQALGAEGHDVEVSLSGSGLVERLIGSRPDLLLLDMALPGASASELCAEVLARRQLDAVRIVLLAGPLEPVDDSDLLPGVHSIIQKPLDASTLSGLVTDLPLAGPGGQGDRVLQALVSEALGQSRPELTREAIRAQIDEAVSAAVPTIVDRITDRLVERLKGT